MNEHDIRQLALMHKQIDSYTKGTIGLSALIGDLIFLRDALSKVESDWEHQFTSCISDLESAWSYALEKNNGVLDSISEKVVNEALFKLRQLLEQPA
ncbi:MULTISPECIES: hypothetical protein [Methylocaldum]|uniref:hypothetical protein n=1 Tax=unclassified Methylocaldum TaxID=2622260 RepID=UPI000989EC5D|nr:MULTISPECIES: hypothetical protein [unclassified Methylocaldum]MBP1149977.1 hypothetical protein [Methylocaldum sp. RMAD-M]MVF21177.1 hypothetical protein [Methylocaldum sp. BRCS4]